MTIAADRPTRLLCRPLVHPPSRRLERDLERDFVVDEEHGVDCSPLDLLLGVAKSQEWEIPDLRAAHAKGDPGRRLRVAAGPGADCWRPGLREGAELSGSKVDQTVASALAAHRPSLDDFADLAAAWLSTPQKPLWHT